MSDTVISQCSNFLIFKMNHPNDVDYIRKMVPNISDEIIEKQKTLQPGTSLGFGMAFTIPLIVKLKMPNPEPKSGNCNVVQIWSGNKVSMQQQEQSSAPVMETVSSDNIKNKEQNIQQTPAISPVQPVTSMDQQQVVIPKFNTITSNIMSDAPSEEPLITVPIQADGGKSDGIEPLITTPINTNGGSSSTSSLNIDEIINAPDTNIIDDE